MVRSELDASVDRALHSLDHDPSRRALAARIDEVLDALERDPGRAELRRHRFVIGMWGVIVGADGEQWIVSWEPHPTIDDAIVTQSIGPASFA